LAKALFGAMVGMMAAAPAAVAATALAAEGWTPLPPKPTFVEHNAKAGERQLIREQGRNMKKGMADLSLDPDGFLTGLRPRSYAEELEEAMSMTPDALYVDIGRKDDLQ
jgi:hypothetical protein